MNRFQYVSEMNELIDKLEAGSIDNKTVVRKVRELVSSSYCAGHDQGYELATKVYRG